MTSVLDKKIFYKYAVVAKDVNHFLEAWLKRGENKIFDQNLFDMMNQFGNILNKKIDFRWSAKRMLEEHDKATEEIMKVELETLEEYEIKYPKIELPKEFELLKTQKRVFEEGMKMRHCIYTNWWSSLKSKNYIAFHVTLNGEEATLACNIFSVKNKDDDKYQYELTFSQCYKKRNQSISNEMQDFCHEWIKNNKHILKDLDKTDAAIVKPTPGIFDLFNENGQEIQRVAIPHELNEYVELPF